MNIFIVNGNFNLMALAVSILIGEGMAFLSKTLSTGSQNTYRSFKQPAWAPPGKTFPIVWTIIFFINGIAGYRIYMLLGNKLSCLALSLYGLLLLLNCTFTILLFRFGKMMLAFKQLILMWLLILASIITFYNFDITSAVLFIPYFLWVSFATVLYYNVVKINKI